MSQYPNVFERFAKIYAGLGDEQLLSLAGDLNQLEPDAQEALQAELQHRRLELQSAVGRKPRKRLIQSIAKSSTVPTRSGSSRRRARRSLPRMLWKVQAFKRS